MPLRIVRLDKNTHNRGAFDCGVGALNNYLKKQAAQHLKRSVSTIFVLADNAAPSRILGFYTLSNSQLVRSDFDDRAAKRLPHHPVPTITLGRMGVDQEGQGKAGRIMDVLDPHQSLIPTPKFIHPAPQPLTHRIGGHQQRAGVR